MKIIVNKIDKKKTKKRKMCKKGLDIVLRAWFIVMLSIMS